MNKLKLAYFLIIVSVILLVINISQLDFNNLDKGNYFGILSNLLLIFAMVINIRDLNKTK